MEPLLDSSTSWSPTFEDFYHRIRYVGRSFNIRYQRPGSHEYVAFLNKWNSYLPNQKVARWLELKESGSVFTPVVMFDRVSTEWVRTFEHCIIMAMFHLATDEGEVWNESLESLNPATDRLATRDPLVLVQFGKYLIYQAYRAYLLELEQAR